MPMYDYRCQACGETFEVLQKFSDAPLTVCESCGGKLEKLLTAPAFHLKGGGWYADGYASSKGGGGGDKDKKAGGDKSDTSGSKKSKSSKDGGSKGSSASSKSDKAS